MGIGRLIQIKNLHQSYPAGSVGAPYDRRVRSIGIKRRNDRRLQVILRRKSRRLNLGLLQILPIVVRGNDGIDSGDALVQFQNRIRQCASDPELAQ